MKQNLIRYLAMCLDSIDDLKIAAIVGIAIL